MISLFLAIAKDLTSLLDFFRREDRAARDRAAAFFSEIADALEKAAERIETGQAGKAVRRELAVYATRLETVIGEGAFRGLGDEPVEEIRARLSEMLEHAVAMYNQPVVLRELAGDPEAERQFWRERNATDRVRRAVEESYGAAHSDRIHEDELEGLLEQELDREGRRTVAAQEVWNAAGEFRGLANAIRAT